MQDTQESQYDLNNPSPEYTRLRKETPKDKLLVEEDGILLIDESTDGKPSFFAVGPEFTILQESTDYAYGDTREEALDIYLVGLKIRARERTIRRFIAVDKELEIARDIYARHDQAIQNLHRVIGIGGHFQDDEGTVYQVAERQWIQVPVKPITVNRTRREGERSGDLSLTAARELGYEVEGEGKKEPKKKKVSAPDAPEFADDPNHANPASIAAFVAEVKDTFPDATVLLTGIKTADDNGKALAMILPIFRKDRSQRSVNEQKLLDTAIPMIEAFEEQEWPMGKEGKVPPADAKIPGTDLPLRDMSDPEESTFIPPPSDPTDRAGIRGENDGSNSAGHY